MFTRGFARQIIAPAGQGQPGVVSAPVHLVSDVIAAQPIAWNIAAAAIQLVIGIGLLAGRTDRTARFALAASIGWALGVWYLGEGLAGLASLDTSLATWVSRHGALAVAALAATEYLIGVGALSRRTRTWAVAAGLVLSIAIWVTGQDLGQLYSGQATDPNTAPLIALIAAVLLARAGLTHPKSQEESMQTTPVDRVLPEASLGLTNADVAESQARQCSTPGSR